VLTAALRQHLNLPHSCKGGSCGTCRVRLVSGRIAYPHGRPIGISAEEEAEGYALICQARAQGDLAIAIREIQSVTDVEIKQAEDGGQEMGRSINGSFVVTAYYIAPENLEKLTMKKPPTPPAAAPTAQGTKAK